MKTKVRMYIMIEKRFRVNYSNLGNYSKRKNTMNVVFIIKGKTLNLASSLYFIQKKTITILI